MSQLGAQYNTGANRAVGSVPIPDTGILSVAQAAASNMAAPFIGLAETARDSPVLSTLALSGNVGTLPALAIQGGAQQIPEGTTQELQEIARQQREDYLMAHPTGMGPWLAGATELGVNALPAAAGIPALAGSTEGLTAAQVAAKMGIAAIKRAPIGAAVGGAIGYGGSYGQSPEERLSAAGQGALVGTAFSALGPPERNAMDTVLERSPAGATSAADADAIAGEATARAQFLGAQVQADPAEAGSVALAPKEVTPVDNLADQANEIRRTFDSDQKLARWRGRTEENDLKDELPADLRQDMTFYYDGQGQVRNPYVPGDTPEALTARVTSNPRAMQILNDLNDHTEAAFARDKALGFSDDVGHQENYLRHVYENDEEATVPPVGSSADTGLMKPRDPDIPTLADAVDAGKIPQTTDFAELQRITKEDLAHTEALHRLMSSVSELPELPDGRPALMLSQTKPFDDYVGIGGRKNPADQYAEAVLRRALQGEEGAAPPYDPTAVTGESTPLIPQAQPTETTAPAGFNAVWAHPDVWDQLMPVLRENQVGAFGNAYDTMNAIAKQANFLGSAFHGVTLGQSLVRSMGLVRGLLTWARLGGGIPGFSQLMHSDYMTGALGDVMDNPMVERGIVHGLEVEPPQIDMEASKFHDAMQGIKNWATEDPGENAPLSDWLGQQADSPLLATMRRQVKAPIGALADALDGIQRLNTESLWENLHTPAKVIAFNSIFDRMLQARAGNLNSLTLLERARLMVPGAMDRFNSMSPTDIGRSTADFVNNQFGGQNWNLQGTRMLSDPRFQKTMRRLFQSPDWNISAFKATGGMFSGDPVMGAASLAAVRSTLAMYVAANLINEQTSGHSIWENPKGREGAIQIGTGADAYWVNFFKHEKEALEASGTLTPSQQKSWAMTPLTGGSWSDPASYAGFLGAPLQFAERKAASIPAGILGLFTGQTPSGFPTPLGKLNQAAQKQRVQPTTPQVLEAQAKQLASMFSPFSVNQMQAPTNIEAIERDLLTMMFQIEKAPRPPWPVAEVHLKENTQ
jgi:hypothetical protein